MAEYVDIEAANTEIKRLKAQLAETEKRFKKIGTNIEKVIDNLGSMENCAEKIAKDYAVKVTEILHCESEEKTKERNKAHLDFIHWDHRAKAFDEALKYIKELRF